MLPAAGTVTLVDGRVVSSSSEDWRLECEARHVLRMPTKADRHDYLYGRPDPKTGIRAGGVMRKRGKAGVERLEKMVMAVWEADRKSQLSGAAAPES